MLPALLIDTLRLGEVGESDLAARWRDADTVGLPELAVYEGASIWLLRRLRAIGAFDLLPGVIRDRLRQQAFDSSALRLEVEAEAAAALTILNRAAVPVILIKGVARCALAGRYPYLDARGTVDVDLLVPSDRIAKADAAFRSEGYVAALPPKPALAPRHHHLPPLRRDRITVELHDSTSVRVPSEVAWARLNEGSELHQWAGQQVRLPSATELAWSAVAHAMEDDAEGFRLRRFLELAALVGSDAPINWTSLVDRRQSDVLFNPAAGVADQAAVADLWLDAALALVAEAKRPKQLTVTGFNLEELLAWRLGVLRQRPRIGRQLADRLLEEGVRALTGLPLEGSPPGAARWSQVRRSVAGHFSRVAFGAWRTGHRSRHRSFSSPSADPGDRADERRPTSPGRY